jgi:hypothetical protein
MNRFTSAVPVVLAFCAVNAAAADEAPSSAAPVTTPVAAKTAATGTAPAAQTGKVQLASASAPSSSGNTSVNRMVCLNMSLQCFSMKPQPGDESAKGQTKSLDLKAPDIRRVAPPMLLAEPDEPVDIEEQQVHVQGTRPEVYVPGGIASLPWAVVHPTQAWRIFLPVPPGTAK